MNSFLRAVEVWRPDASGQELVFSDGLYGELTAFFEASVAMRFAHDEGLPGKAWAARHPIVLKQFENSYFKRTEAAIAAGLTCGVALPIFSGTALRAVVVFFCGDGGDADHVGVIELWKHDPERSPGLRFVDGYFGIAETFEWNARNVTFMRGFGLPGQVWLQNRPVLLSDLGNSLRFLRAQDARRVGLSKGLGIPCGRDPEHVWVMLFLSALGTPIAHRTEIWRVEKDGRALAFHAGDCDRDPGFATTLAGSRLRPGEGAAGEAWLDGAPIIRHRLARETSLPGMSAAAAGLSSMIALPIFGETAVTSVVSMYF